MSFMTADSWYEVQFLPLGSAPWAALSYAPVMGSMILTSLLKNEPIVMYVTSSATGSAVTRGGEISGLDDSLVKSAIPLKSIDLASETSTPLHLAKDVAGNLLVYNQVLSQTETYLGANAAALKAWL